MALPSILRPRKRTTEKHDPSSRPTSTEHSAQSPDVTDGTLKRATRLRKGFALSAAAAYFLSWIFLVLVSKHLLYIPNQKTNTARS